MHHKIQPLVSIIMPSYNSSSTIRESILSILAQSYNHWELLITDDNSSDNTIEIVRQFSMDDARIKFYINNENYGAGYARNNSINHSSGKYIAFLDSDDLWLPDKLFKQVMFMETNNYYLTYTAYQKFSSSGDCGIVMPIHKVSYNKLLCGNIIGCLTAMYNAEHVGKTLMPLIRKRQDMALWLLILRKCDFAYCLPEVLAKYRIDSGMTRNKFDAACYQWRLYRDVLKLDLSKSIFYFLMYAVNGIVKTL